jgi:hypothetical protein
VAYVVVAIHMLQVYVSNVSPILDVFLQQMLRVVFSLAGEGSERRRRRSPRVGGGPHVHAQQHGCVATCEKHRMQGRRGRLDGC